jgi:C4-dicarboxylate transporter, DctQ subunit
MKGLFRGMDRGLCWFEAALSRAFLALAAALAVFQVALRYLFGLGIPWGAGAVINLVVWAVFVGSGEAVRRDTHIRLEVLVEKLPPRSRHAVTILSEVCCLAFSLTVAVLALQFEGILRESGEVSPATYLPEYVLFLSLPLGASLMSLRFLQSLVHRIRQGPQAA